MILRKIKTVLKTPPRNWVLLGHVLGLSIQARYMDLYRASEFRPERWLHVSLRDPANENDIQRVRDIAWAVRKVSKITPWMNVCRHQAWQAAVLMSQSGLRFHYFIGAKKGESGYLDGHSWVISASRFVSGRCNVLEYKVIQSFN